MTTTSTGQQGGLHASLALDPGPTTKGRRTVNETLSRPLCVNGDGELVHAQDRCKPCYNRALASGEIVAGRGGAVTRLRLEPWSPDWTARAACGASDPETWFPAAGDDGLEARMVCARCPVQRECLELANSLPSQPDGIWAGLDREERQYLERRLAA